MKNAYFHIKNLCAMEVIAVICVVGPMVVHVGHPSHMRQRQFPRVLNLEHLEDGAEVSIRQMSWSNQTIYHFFSRECFGKPIVWDAANGEQCDEHDERFW